MRISIEKNLLSIDNYNQIIDIKNDLIVAENIIIYGSDLRVIFLDKYRIVIKGLFKKIKLGDIINEIQNYNE